MSVAKGNSAADQVVSKISSGRKASLGSAVHRVFVGNNGRHHVGECAQAVGEGIDAIEQWFLVFLVIFVVGQRLGFHQRQ